MTPLSIERFVGLPNPAVGQWFQGASPSPHGAGWGRWFDRDEQNTWVLYRLYTEDLLLLYVGITQNPSQRMTSHKSQTWWPRVDLYVMYGYPTEGAVLKAERLAIRAERPLYNIALAVRV